MANNDTAQSVSGNGTAPPSSGTIQSEAPDKAKKRAGAAWTLSPITRTPVNSIGVPGSRTRSKNRGAQAAEPPSLGAKGSVATPVDAESAVAEHIRERYIQVRTRFHFKDGDLAFQVQSNRTAVHSTNPQVIRDVLEVERARHGTDTLWVRGTPQFRKEVWMQGELAGIKIRGYRPSEVERAILAQTIEKGRRPPELRDDPFRTSAAREETVRVVDASPGVPNREQAPPDLGRPYQGRLVNYGKAPWQHDRRNEMSFYLVIETETGEKTLWGKDLERAIKESLSQVKVGDSVAVQQVGARPVTVLARRRDSEGNVVRREEISAYLNRWVVESKDFLREREALADIVRDSTIDAKTAVGRNPNLAGVYLELHAAKLAASELSPHPVDQRRFVERYRRAVADEIARGEQLPVSPVREPVKRVKLQQRDPRAREQERALS